MNEAATTGYYWKTERMSNTPTPSPEELQRMREKSGSITDNRPLVIFLYKLMRDELPPGKVEQLLLESGIDEPVTTPREVTFTNGWLAQQAQDIAFRLTGWDNSWPISEKRYQSNLSFFNDGPIPPSPEVNGTWTSDRWFESGSS